MNNEQKIHLLSQELIPVIEDLDSEPKQVVLDHIKECKECQRLYSNAIDFDDNFPEVKFSEDAEIKPLKKLVQFNTGLKLLLIAVRAIILFYVLYSSISYYDWETSATMILDVMQAGILLFYLPAAVFLLVFTFTFFNKKWLLVSFVSDLIVILFLGIFLRIFI